MWIYMFGLESHLFFKILLSSKSYNYLIVQKMLSKTNYRCDWWSGAKCRYQTIDTLFGIKCVKISGKEDLEIPASCKPFTIV